ncbi:MAG: glutaredoxin family protein [Dehalococcoidia bacterium]
MPKEITLYTTRTCRVCGAARRYLAEKGISYKDVVVSNDGKAKYLLRKLTGRIRTPVWVIDGYVVTDFNPARIDALLAS